MYLLVAKMRLLISESSSNSSSSIPKDPLGIHPRWCWRSPLASTADNEFNMKIMALITRRAAQELNNFAILVKTLFLSHLGFFLEWMNDWLNCWLSSVSCVVPFFLLLVMVLLNGTCELFVYYSALFSLLHTSYNWGLVGTYYKGVHVEIWHGVLSKLHRCHWIESCHVHHFCNV